MKLVADEGKITSRKPTVIDRASLKPSGWRRRRQNFEFSSIKKKPNREEKSSN